MISRQGKKRDIALKYLTEASKGVTLNFNIDQPKFKMAKLYVFDIHYKDIMKICHIKRKNDSNNLLLLIKKI